MSSLRLALKQSLQESGLALSSSERKKKKRSRLKMYSVSPSDDDECDIANENRSSRKKRRNRPYDEQVDDDDNNSCSSEENEFSHIEEDDVDDNNDSGHSDEGDGEEDNESENEDDENNSSESLSSTKKRHHSRKSPEPQCDENRKKQNYAAHKIQNRWKQKQESRPPEDDNEENESDTEKGAFARVSRKQQALAGSSDEKHKSKHREAESNKKASRVSKAKFVAPPDPRIVEWMNEMGVVRCRKTIKPGMRVKVRFATQVVVRRKDGSSDDPENAPLKKVRKKKWFGGRVSAVSKEGSKIRIKYDDGTSEVTKFPDKDIVVDDTNNGIHLEPTDSFIPPPESPHSPPFGKKSRLLTSSLLDSVSLDLVDTPMQPVHATLELKVPVPNIELQRAPDFVFDRQPNDQPRPVESHFSSTRNGGVEDRISTTNHVSSNVKTQFTFSDTNSVISNLNQSTFDEQARSLEEDNAIELSDSTEQDSHQSNTLSNHEEVEKPHGQITDNRSMLSENKSDVLQRQPSDINLKKDESFFDDESFKYEDVPTMSTEKQNFRKSVALSSKHVSTIYEDVESDSKVDLKEEKLQSLDESLVSLPSKQSQEHNKPSLKIRITAIRSDNEKSGISSKAADISTLDKDGKRQGKKKRNRTECEQSSEVPPAKKFHIHIQPQQRNQEDSSGGDVTSPKKAQKRKIITSDDQSTLLSPTLSPHNRKKRKKFLNGESTVLTEEKEGTLLESSPLQISEAFKPVRVKKSFPVPTTELLVTKKIVIGSKNSAFDSQVSVGENSIDSRPTTPLENSKKDNLDTPIVRSGRRAAQQANERISSKQDIGTQVGKKKKKNKDGEAGEKYLVDLLEDSQWVQCDKCKKWRVIPSSVVDTLPNQWFCADNIYDPKRANCDAPEQSDKEVARERKKKLKKQQRLLSQKVDSSEQIFDSIHSSSNIKNVDIKEKQNPDTNDDEIVQTTQSKEKFSECNSSPIPKHNESDTKSTKRFSPSDTTLVHSESGSDNLSTSKHERVLPCIGVKKVKPQLDAVIDKQISSDCNDNLRRGRGRPRRNQCKEVSNVSSNGGNADCGKIDDDNLEWVQCEKCDKWRRLPSHISADDLPDLWYCEMNTWNTESASCDVPEDKADGMQDVGGFGGTGGLGIGKLTYRNLIFGSTGRKLNRPVSEKARAAESLFSIHQDEEDQPSRVLYAESSAFVCRARPNLLSDDSDRIGVFDLMRNSSLWNELRNASCASHTDFNFIGRNDRAARLSSFTYETLPLDVKKPMKDVVLYFLGDSTATGEEILERGQAAATINTLSNDFDKARQYWAINVVVTTIAELVKDGIVDCVWKKVHNHPSSMSTSDDLDSLHPHYRRSVSSCSRSTVSAESMECTPCSESSPTVKSSGTMNRSVSRCMKIAKPWKVRGGTSAQY